jgi:membrane-associated phospholipid phosphatase
MSPNARKQGRSLAAAAQRVGASRGASSLWSTALRELGTVDRAAYQAVAQTPTPSLDRPMRSLSNAANRSRLWIAIAAAVAVAGGMRGRRAALEGLVSIGVSSASAHLIASTAARPRPDREGLERFASREVGMPASSSFPSRHAASGFAFSYAMGRHLPELAVPVRLLAGTVAYSRVHIGVHYPGDVVVGSIIGSGIAAMVASAGDRLAARRRSGGRRGERPSRASGRPRRVRSRASGLQRERRGSVDVEPRAASFGAGRRRA